MDDKLQTALIAGAVGTLVSVVLTWSVPMLRRSMFYWRLRVTPEQRARGNRGTARVYNGHTVPMNSVFAYITIENKDKDVVGTTDEFSAFIGPGNPSKVEDDRLCWSMTWPSSNPPVVDVYSFEGQRLDIVNIDPEKKWIEIPSEKGWSSPENKAVVERKRRDGKEDDIRTSRVFLKYQKYDATIKLVSKDSKAKKFRIVIDPDLETPIQLRKVRLPRKLMEWVCKPWF